VRSVDLTVRPPKKNWNIFGVFPSNLYQAPRSPAAGLCSDPAAAAAGRKTLGFFPASAVKKSGEEYWI